MRGTAYAHKYMQEAAIRDFNRAIELDPQGADAYHWRAMAYAYQGLTDLALADFARALDLKPSDPANTYYERGKLYMTLGQNDAARRDLQQAAVLGHPLAGVELAKLG